MNITNPIEESLNKVEYLLIHGNPSERQYWADPTSKNWRGIDIEWHPLALKRGGKLKRKGTYGVIKYIYRGKELTRDEAITEACKPPELRQAIIDAETWLECAVCGKVVVGKDASDPYHSVHFDIESGKLIQQRAWGLMFYRMNPDRVNEPETLSICPDCMGAIAKGRFHRD